MEIYRGKKKTTYRERIFFPNGTSETKSFDRISDAKTWKREHLRQIQLQQALGIKFFKSKKTFGEVCAEWFESVVLPNRAYKTIRDYSSIRNNHLTERFSSLLINDLTRAEIEQFQNNLLKSGLMPKTVTKIMGVLKSIFNYACKMEYLVRSPAFGLTTIRSKQGRIEFLTETEVRQLLNHCRFSEIYPIVLIALNSGMRIGEILGMHWDQLYWDNGSIEVCRTMDREGVKMTTKTGLVRSVPMNDTIQVELKKLFMKQSNPNFVFVRPNGLPYNSDHFCQRYFKPLLKSANIRSIRFHDLRHTFASHFIMKGGSIFNLQKILGHTSINMTMKYAHLSNDYLKSAVQIIQFGAMPASS